MPKVESGNFVKIHYTGKLEDGTVFDTSENREPLQFKVGEGKMIPGFEQAVIGMKPGEKKTEKIEADHAYGPYRQELIFEVGTDKFPDDITPQVGLELQITNKDGNVFPAVVREMEEDKVKLDANHPLAGKDLIFDIEVVDVK